MTLFETLTNPPADLFEPFLDALEHRFSRTQATDGCSVPEGIGELTTPSGIVEFAVSRTKRFAALRWLEPDAEVQAFFVQSSADKTQCGLRVRPLDLAEGVPTTLLQWWQAATGQTAAESVTPSKKLLPTFMKLATLLATSGQVFTTETSSADTSQSAERERDYYQELCEDQADELRRLRAKLRETSQLGLRRVAAPIDDTLATSQDLSEQDDLTQLPEWAQKNEERIVVTARALNGAKKSLYLRPALIFRALEYLAGPYRDYRLNRIERAAVDEALTKSGLRMSGSAGPSVAGAEGEAYFVQFDGRRRFLEHHLLKGGGRDERYCLRVYFFWDEVSQRVVVGSLPAHLDNSLT